MKNTFRKFLVTLLIVATFVGMTPVQAAQFVADTPNGKTVVYQPEANATYKVTGIDTVLDNPLGGKHKSLTSFNKKMTIGCTDNGTGDSGSANLSMYSEGWYGVKFKIKNNKVYAKLYKNIAYDITLDYVFNATSVNKNKKLTDELNATMNKDKWVKLNVNVKNNSAETLTFRFDGYNENALCSVFVYNDNGKLWLCKGSANTKSEVEKRYETFNYYMDKFGLTEKNTTDISKITYPILENKNYNWRCDTDRWAQKGKEIVKEFTGSRKRSDNFKAFVLYRWVVQNIAYDYYKVNVLGDTREFANHDHSGTWSTWNTMCGVCHDQSHVLLIMLRANGIPAVIVDSGEHEWVAFWNNETKEWWELNPTEDGQYGVYGKDVTKIVRDAKNWGMSSFDHSKALPKIKGVDMQMWTETAVWNGVTHTGVKEY